MILFAHQTKKGKKILTMNFDVCGIYKWHSLTIVVLY